MSAPSAHALISQLVRKGYLKREANKARGLSVVRDAEPRPGRVVSVPIVGSIAAGRPILAEENIIGEVLMDASTVRDASCFALRVKGQSMVEAGIQDKDLIVVQRQQMAEHGDIVVALLGDEATVKKLHFRESRIELHPANPKFKPIVVGVDDELKILGKVVAVRQAREIPKG
jgi:repressor LexA